MTQPSIRTVIVDDSDVAASRLEHILEASADIRVLHRFRGLSEMEPAHLRGVDVVLLDMWMPGRSGLGAVRELAARCAVVMVSEAPPDSDLAQEALAQGALGFVSKHALGTAAGTERLMRVVRDAARSRRAGKATALVALVGSTGAPRALLQLAPDLVHLTAAIVVVQHMPFGRERRFAQWLTSFGLAARPARDRDRLCSNRTLVAPSGRQMTLDRSGWVRLADRRPGELHAPSADVFLTSAAQLGSRVVAVVLSGMGADGSLGARAVAAAGGVVLVQAPGEAPVSSMPLAALTASEGRALPTARLVAGIAEALRER